MYKKFYLMQKEPFDSHPSPELFYKSTAHQNGWNYLIQGIKSNEPNLLMTGDYGAGKTLLYLKLMKLFKKNTHLPSVCISTPAYNFIMVLEKIIKELNITAEGIDSTDESRLQQAIHKYFEKKKDDKRKIIYVIIDDAQEFSYSFVNKIRLFASYNHSGFFPIRIILFAHPYFLKMLNYKKMIAFGQRIKRIYSLRALGFEETREYIYFRLIQSGASGSPVFDDEAIKFIQKSSRGNPRLINNICDNCLLVASNQKSNIVNQSMATQAIANGNLMGIDMEKEVPYPKDASLPPQQKSTHIQPLNPKLSRHTEKRVQPPAQPITDRNNNQKAVAESRQDKSRQYKKIPSEKREPKKNNFKNISSNFRKKGFIIILILIILFLLFYLFNQTKSKEMYDLQSKSEQIIKPTHQHLYTVGNSNLFKNGESLKNKNENNSNMNAPTSEIKLHKKDSYHPIILIENLM
jgi:general secretion pathway protein A